MTRKVASMLQSRRRLSVGRAILLVLLTSIYSVGPTQGIYARTEPGDPPTYCTVFHHMVKSAGSTMKNVLGDAALEDGVPAPVGCAMGRDPTCLKGIEMSPVIVGYGEIIREPLQDAGRQCEYFTMMRHPVDRLVSAFFYCPKHDVQIRPSKHCGYSDHPVPATERLLDFATRRWGCQAFKQMTHSIYCPQNAVCEPSKEPRPELSLDIPAGAHLFQQCQGILSTYAAVGIVEHFNLSMELFNARVKSPVRDWTLHNIPVNAGRASGLKEDVLEWAKSSPEILRVVEADMLLYNYSMDIFKRQTAESLGTVWTE